ncbi:MAG: cytochrome c [Mariprofundales bacterium]|nr:cytochrome c [Mariprofundales bacterium]
MIAGAISVVVVAALAKGVFFPPSEKKTDQIPFYSTSSHKVEVAAADLYRHLGCRDCHSLWGVHNITEFVPAPMLDGIGSWRSEAWLYAYFSAKDPQKTIPSRLKPRYRMPSYAYLPEAKRHQLARYFAGLKVQDWYLKKSRAAEYEKLTGHKQVTPSPSKQGVSPSHGAIKS